MSRTVGGQAVPRTYPIARHVAQDSSPSPTNENVYNISADVHGRTYMILGGNSG